MLYPPPGWGEQERLGIDAVGLAVDCLHAAAGEIEQPLGSPSSALLGWHLAAHRHHLHADRGKCDQRQLDVLDPEGNADDRHEAGHCGGEVADRQPPARHQKPDHVAHHPEGSGPEVVASGELPPAHGLIPKRPEGVVADHKAGPGRSESPPQDRPATNRGPSQRHPARTRAR